MYYKFILLLFICNFLSCLSESINSNGSTEERKKKCLALLENKHFHMLNCNEFICQASINSTDCIPAKSIEGNREHQCMKMVGKFKVIPGESFGTMPIDKQNYFMSIDCDEVRLILI